MFAGVAILLIFQKLSKYKFITVLISAITIFFMITSPIVNPNNQLYAKELSGRSALIQSEIEAAEFINWLNPREIHANSKYIYFINMNYGDYKNLINPDKPDTYRSGLVILRNYDLEKGFTIPLFGAKGKLLEVIYPSEEFYKFLNNSIKMYENGEVRIYYNT